ncbi:hypothetical protein DPMN_060784 [Dreissena polymorpha]|uniref:C2H2-type domain-containing protein n=1 Tax=Dreissena polymorpha TaxID=45954 RepID=A0A9D4C5V8_DREPO|nr:hypothetical protein DPMN_060784 [Dreissena polymorpha]
MYKCDTCQKLYKYKKNLLKHVREHHQVVEHWNCSVTDCNIRFIRRSYLSKHLVQQHGIAPSKAREDAVSAPRENQTPQNAYYDDVSEDDSILDLLSYNDFVKEFESVIEEFDLSKFEETKPIDVSDTHVDNESSAVEGTVDDVDVSDMHVDNESSAVKGTVDDVDVSDMHVDNETLAVEGTVDDVDVSDMHVDNKSSAVKGTVDDVDVSDMHVDNESSAVEGTVDDVDDFDVYDVSDVEEQDTHDVESEIDVNLNDDVDHGSEQEIIDDTASNDIYIVVSSGDEDNSGDKSDSVYSVEPDSREVVINTSRYITQVWNFAVSKRVCICDGQEHVLRVNTHFDYNEQDN